MQKIGISIADSYFCFIQHQLEATSTVPLLSSPDCAHHNNQQRFVCPKFQF